MNLVTVSSLGPFFEGSINRMSHVTRYSGSPVLKQENVAEHSYWVAMIAATISLDLGLGQIAAGEVALRGLVHDVEESLTGDIIRDTKYDNPEILLAIKQVESVKAELIFKELRIPGRTFHQIWKSAKDASIEGQIVKLADFLSVTMYCYREQSTGNSGVDMIGILQDVCRNILGTFPKGSTLGEYARDILFGMFDWLDETYEEQK